MKKTAKQLVYDAVDYMRKPAVDFALSPTQDSDNVFKTYGWNKRDVCKLCNLIEMDAETNIPHNTIHEVETVGEIVVEIDKIINKRFSHSIKDSEFILSQVAKMEMANEYSSLMLGLSSIRAIYELAEGDLTAVKELEEKLFDMMMLMRDIANPSNIDKFTENLMTKVTIRQFSNKRKEIVEIWAKKFQDAGARD